MHASTSTTSTSTTPPPSFDRAALGTLMAAMTAPVIDNTEHYRNELQTLLSRVVPPVAGRAKTAVAAAATIPPLPYGSYRFDIQEAIRERRSAVVRMRPPALYEILETLSFHREPGLGLPLSYGDIRVWWCLINVRLNELGLDFPAFRPNRRPAKPAGGYTGDDTLLTNDRQLIDLHWLWHSGSPVTPKPKHRTIFDTRPHPETGAEAFDWELAAHFVGRVGAVKTKLEDLKLHEDEQFPLMALRSDAVKQRQADILKRCAELEGVLRRQAARRNSRLDPVTIPDWIQDYVALRLAEGSPTEAVNERVRLFGESFDVRHMTNRKRDLVKLDFRVREGRAKV